MNISRSLPIIFLCLLTLGCQNAKEEKVKEVTPDVAYNDKVKIPENSEVKYTTDNFIFISSLEGSYIIDKNSLKVSKISKEHIRYIIQNEKTGDTLVDTYNDDDNKFMTIVKKDGSFKQVPTNSYLSFDYNKYVAKGSGNIDFVISYSYSPKVDIIYTNGTTKTISAEDPKDSVKKICYSSEKSIVLSYYRSPFIKVILQDGKIKTINNQYGFQYYTCLRELTSNESYTNTIHNNNKDDGQDIHISAIEKDYIEIDRNDDNSIKIKTPENYIFDKIYSGSLSGNIVILYQKNSYGSHESYITVLNKDNQVKNYKVNFNENDLIYNIRSANFNNILLVARRTINWESKTEIFLINKDGDLKKLPLVSNSDINDVAYNSSLEKFFISFDQLSTVEIFDMKTASIGYIPGVKTTNSTSYLRTPKNSDNSKYFLIDYAGEAIIVASKNKFIKPITKKDLTPSNFKYFKNGDVSLTFNRTVGDHDLMVITNKGKFIYIPTK